MTQRIRIVIADDSSLARGLLRAILESEEGIEVVGEAADGCEAVALTRELHPDLLTMDLDMPRMSGMEAIEEIMATRAVPILVISGAADAHNALEAVRRGALDVVTKPEYGEEAAAGLVAKVKLLAKVPVITHLRPRAVTAASVAPVKAPPVAPIVAASGSKDYQRVVVIAASTGGPQALAQILGGLPADFPFPVLISQHISDGFAAGMAEWLAGLSKLPVRVGTEGESILAGHVYLSPSEQNLAVAHGRRLTLAAREPHQLYHPACDVLLESAASVFGRSTIGIILTGMGHDGAAGMSAIRRQGGATLGQDEASSVIFGMNRVAIEQGSVERVMPLVEIAPALLRLAGAAHD